VADLIARERGEVARVFVGIDAKESAGAAGVGQHCVPVRDVGQADAAGAVGEQCEADVVES
jgi:hypothetical protein